MIVVQGRSCNFEVIGEGSCVVTGKVIDMVSCMEGCMESDERIGWMIGSLG